MPKPSIRNTAKPHDLRQVEKFVEAARTLGCDETEGQLDAVMKQLGTTSKASVIAHASDCAIHNGPALEAGECDCGAVKVGR